MNMKLGILVSLVLSVPLFAVNKQDYMRAGSVGCSWRNTQIWSLSGVDGAPIGAKQAVFTNDGQYVFVVTVDGNIFQGDAQIGEQVDSLKKKLRKLANKFVAQKFKTKATKQEDISVEAYSIAVSPDDAYVAIAAKITVGKEEKWGIFELDITSWLSEINDNFSYDLGNDIVDASCWVAYSPDGKKLAASTAPKLAEEGSPNERAEANVIIWDFESGDKLHTLKGHTYNIWSVDFSPDSKKVVTASEDGKVIVWDAQIGSRLLTIGAFVYQEGSYIPSGVNVGDIIPADSAMFSRDGARVLVAFEDAGASIYNATTGDLIKDLYGQHVDEVVFAAYSPDNSLIVTSSKDDRAIVWNTANGQVVSLLEDHTGNVNTAVFSRNGKRIVTASEDSTVIVWDKVCN